MSGNSSKRLLLFFGRCSLVIVAFAAALMSCMLSLAATITPGNLVLVRIAGGPNGDASIPLAGGVGQGVYLDEYTTSGTFVQTFAAPNTRSTVQGSQRALTLSAGGTEGLLTLSGNGQYLVMGGYNQTANAAGVNGSPSYNEVNPLVTPPVERIAGRMDLNGNWDTSTTFIDAMSSQNIRSAYSPDGVNFYVTGNGGNGVTVNAVAGITTNGVHLGVLGVNTGGQVLSTQVNPSGNVSNNRQVLIRNGTIYVSNGNTSSPNSPNRGVDKIAFDSGTGQNQLFSLPGFPTAAGQAPDDFWFFDDNTIYLADARTNGLDGGIQKWTFDGTNWNRQYTLGTTQLFSSVGTNVAAGVHGLAGTVNGSGNAVLYGTIADGTATNINRFFVITDTGAGSAVTYLATSGTNTSFRGIELIPLAIPEPGSLSLLVVGAVGAVVRARRRRK